MDVNLEEFFKAEEYLDEVNKQSIDSTRFFYKGKQLSVSKKGINQWKKVGYSISTVIIGEFKEEYKEWSDKRWFKFISTFPRYLTETLNKKDFHFIIDNINIFTPPVKATIGDYIYIPEDVLTKVKITNISTDSFNETVIHYMYNNEELDSSYYEVLPFTQSFDVLDKKYEPFINYMLSQDNFENWKSSRK